MPKTYHEKVKDFARRRYKRGFSAAQTARQMEMAEELQEFDLPSLRTVQIWFNEFQQEGKLEFWTLEDTPGEDAQIVYEALRYEINELKKFEPQQLPRITKKLADTVIRIKKACPSLPSEVLMVLADLYSDGKSKDEIDLLLIYKPFESYDAYADYVECLKIVYKNNWESHAFYKLLLLGNSEGKQEITPVWDINLKFTRSPVLDDDYFYPPARLLEESKKRLDRLDDDLQEG